MSVSLQYVFLQRSLFHGNVYLAFNVSFCRKLHYVSPLQDDVPSLQSIIPCDVAICFMHCTPSIVSITALSVCYTFCNLTQFPSPPAMCPLFDAIWLPYGTAQLGTVLLKRGHNGRMTVPPPRSPRAL
jgi:hypothetical protein